MKHIEEETITIPVGRIMGVLGYVLAFGLGAGVVLLSHNIDESASYDSGHRSGYQEGRASCSEPSRMEQALGGAARWLSSPGHK